MTLLLPTTSRGVERYQLASPEPTQAEPLARDSARIIYAAAHVVPDIYATSSPSDVALDMEATLKFRRHLSGLGLGIAEAMDTSQRGMGLTWENAKTVIKATCEELPDALVAHGVGTDHLDLAGVSTLDQVIKGYLEQLNFVQGLGGQVILMASRALAKIAKTSADYVHVYSAVLAEADQPVILHWLGDMFDPALQGYWGCKDFSDAMETCLEIIELHQNKIDGIKISLLDKDKEIEMRRRLPDRVVMYTGDDFNYPELIAGDDQGFSHALLGIFDPLAPLAARAVNRLSEGDVEAFRSVLDPTVHLARLVFRAPTQYYKTGVVFLAWLNGFQDHFAMVSGAQSARGLHDFAQMFKLADQAGVLINPELAVHRMCHLMATFGIE